MPHRHVALCGPPPLFPPPDQIHPLGRLFSPGLRTEMVRRPVVSGVQIAILRLNRLSAVPRAPRFLHATTREGGNGGGRPSFPAATRADATGDAGPAGPVRREDLR